jgi:hypothetical protein
MPEPTLDREPSSAPVEPNLAKPTADALLHDLESARNEAQSWRGRFIASCVGFVCLLVVSVIQFGGAFVTCQLLHETRVETDKALHESRGFMRNIQHTQQEAQYAKRLATEATRRATEAEKITGDLRFAYEDLKLAYREQELILGRLLEWQRKIDAERPAPRETLPKPKSSQE